MMAKSSYLLGDLPENEMLPEDINKVNFHFNREVFADGSNHFRGIELVQAGDISCEAGFVEKEHTQICHELTLIITGEVKVKVNEMTYTLKPGDICVSPHGTTHTIEAVSAMRYQYFAFRTYRDVADCMDPDLLQKVENAMKYCTTFVFQNSKIQMLMSMLLEELALQENFGRTAIDSILHSILVFLMRSLDDNQDIKIKEREQANSKTELRTLYQMVRYFQNHYQANVRIQDVADELGYSKYYLSHSFQKATGRSIQDYLLDYRMNIAKRYLESGEYKIGEVAKILGYKSHQAFTRAFKKQVGLSPTAYQQKKSN